MIENIISSETDLFSLRVRKVWNVVSKEGRCDRDERHNVQIIKIRNKDDKICFHFLVLRRVGDALISRSKDNKFGNRTLDN